MCHDHDPDDLAELGFTVYDDGYYFRYALVSLNSEYEPKGIKRSSSFHIFGKVLNRESVKAVE